MKSLFVSTLVAGAMFASTGVLRAEHKADCKGVHGKITALTEEGVTVNDKFYKIGKTTRITKDEKVVKFGKLSAGDIVCLDTRGKDDVATSGEVAAVSVLSSKDATSYREKEVVREKERISEPSSPSREVIIEKEKIREEK